MKEHPILFNSEMVKALLDGRKTQTRRVIKPQPDHVIRNAYHTKGLDIPRLGEDIKCPYGKVGDKLWVRETFCKCDKSGLGLVYRADGEKCKACQSWKPSIHMPRWASRITLEVVSVRVERVQDISEENAKAEGVAPLFTEHEIHNPRYRSELDLKPMPYTNYLWHGFIGRSITAKQSDSWECQSSSYKRAKDSFSSLWQTINDKRGFGWDKNPWVWVVEFKRVEI